MSILDQLVTILIHPAFHALIAVVVIGFFTVVALIKFYAYVTCGFFHEKVKMNGKTVIVTGATGGIGKETARELAKRGARVIIACRNVVSGEKVKGEYF